MKNKQGEALVIRHWKRMTGLLLVAGMLAISSGRAYAAGSTAKVALDEAIETAQNWRPDAILTNVSSVSVGTDGKAPTWFYGFYSPKSRSFLNVTAKGRSLDTLELGTGQKEAVPTDFLDTDKVMEEAVQAGLKGDSPRMGLTRTAWIVSGGQKTGDSTLFLNPKTGRLIKRQAVQ